MSKLFVHRIKEKQLILRDADLTRESVKMPNGKTYTIGTQSNCKFGVLVVRDDQGNPVDHQTLGAEVGGAITGFNISDTEVLHMETKQPIPNLFWCEKA